MKVLVINAGSSSLKFQVIDMENKSVTINVISKSGTTLEPNIAFDLIYQKDGIYSYR